MIDLQPIRFDLGLINGKKFVVFGDFIVDEYLQGTVSRVSPEAPVPIVQICSQKKQMGGAGNVVLNLRAMGAYVAAAGYLGNDDEGGWLIRRMKDFGVDTTGILQDDATVTSIKTRVTAQNQQLLRYDVEVINEAPQSYINFLSNGMEQLLKDASAVIVSDYGKGVVTEDTVRRVIHAARERGIPVMVDPKGNNYQKYRGASVCTPNMKELQLAVGRELHGEEDILTASRELCVSCGIEMILVTRSEKGMSLIFGADGAKKDYQALAREVTDVTGAGDTVISIFTLCFALGASPDDSCRLANMAASIVVSKFGAATVAPEELQALVEKVDGYRTKVLSRREAEKIAAFLHREGKRIVFTNGCFDIVHAGHISSFRQARRYGDVLFLGLNSDSSVRRMKGAQRPIVSQDARLSLLEAITYIDYIVLFDEDTPEDLIQTIRPDVLVKGRDWEGKPVAGGEFVQRSGGKVCFIDLEDGLSTTSIIQKILIAYGGVS